MKILRLLLCASALFFLILNPAPAQNSTNYLPPTVQSGLQEIVDAVKTGNTNWDITVYGLYASKLKQQYGGGIGVFWPLSTYVVTGVRCDYLEGDFWMPVGNATLQLPVQLNSWLRVTPLVYAGIGVPITGAGSANGSAVAIIGIGGALRLAGGKTWYLDAVIDQETWSGFAGKQDRVGFLFNKSF